MRQDKAELHTSHPLDVVSALEKPTCPFCQGEHAHTIFEGGDDWVPDGSARMLRFSVVRCDACRAHYTTPRFREAEKHLAFAGSYPFYQRARQNISAPTEEDMQAFARRVNMVERFCPQPGNILDLGMGDGVFLAAMRRRGWQATGIDSEPDVVAYARRQLGLASCMVADAERDRLPEGPYDVVTMWGMLQLSYRPQLLLEKIRTTLTPDGIIAIGVSNIGSAGARLFRSHWRGLGLPRHLIHFDPASLRRLVEQAGYRPLVAAFETPYWITGPSVAAALPLPGLLGGLTRRCMHGILSLAGRTRLGDTMILLARVDR
jgi:SAM-dependent methyltransferase